MTKYTNKKIDAGIIGTGYGNYVILEAINKISFIRNKTIFGRDKEKIKKLFKLGKVNIADHSIQKFINRDNQLICIATLPDIQYEFLNKIKLNKYRYYFLEKPLASNFIKSKKLFNKFKRIKSKVAVDFIFLGLKSFQNFKKILNKINIKEVKIKWHFNAHHFRKKITRSWKKNSKYGGGIYHFYIIHIIAYINYFFGRISKIENKIEIKNISNELCGVILNLVCKNKIKIHLDFNSNSEDIIHSIEIYTKKKNFKLENKSKDYVKNFKIVTNNRKTKTYKNFPFKNDLKNLDSRVEPVIELIKKLVIEKKPISTIKEGFNASEDLQKIINKNASK